MSAFVPQDILVVNDNAKYGVLLSEHLRKIYPSAEITVMTSTELEWGLSKIKCDIVFCDVELFCFGYDRESLELFFDDYRDRIKLVLTSPTGNFKYSITPRLGQEGLKEYEKMTANGYLIRAYDIEELEVKENESEKDGVEVEERILEPDHVALLESLRQVREIAKSDPVADLGAVLDIVFPE